MGNLRRTTLAAVVGVAALVLVAGAAGKTSSRAKIRRVQGRIEALALDGSRIAYDVGSSTKVDNRVLVWNVRTGKTTKVSGNKTRHADTTSTGSGVLELAIAGTRVAWIVNLGGNTEGDDYMFTSSVTKPKERQVASATRFGDSCSGGPPLANPACAGTWLGGLVGSGKLIAVNRWITDPGAAISVGGLYVLGSTRLKQVASGADTVEAASADAGRVAVLASDGTVGLYSASGKSLLTITPSSAEGVALSGRNLVVLTAAPALEVYNAETGHLRKTRSVQGKAPQNFDVQGNIAIYTTGPSIHAVNLSSGKDRAIGKLSGGIGLARIGAAGVAYASSRFADKGTLVFQPWAKVAAAVS